MSFTCYASLTKPRVDCMQVKWITYILHYGTIGPYRTVCSMYSMKWVNAHTNISWKSESEKVNLPASRSLSPFLSICKRNKDKTWHYQEFSEFTACDINTIILIQLTSIFWYPLLCTLTYQSTIISLMGKGNSYYLVMRIDCQDLMVRSYFIAIVPTSQFRSLFLLCDWPCDKSVGRTLRHSPQKSRPDKLSSVWNRYYGFTWLFSDLIKVKFDKRLNPTCILVPSTFYASFWSRHQIIFCNIKGVEDLSGPGTRKETAGIFAHKKEKEGRG